MRLFPKPTYAAATPGCPNGYQHPAGRRAGRQAARATVSLDKGVNTISSVLWFGFPQTCWPCAV